MDTDLIARAAWKVHGLLTHHGLHTLGGHTLARELEYWYSPWSVRPTFDADPAGHPGALRSRAMGR